MKARRHHSPDLQHRRHEETVITLDRLKDTGFDMATRAGVSIGIDDMIIPPAKISIVKASQED